MAAIDSATGDAGSILDDPGMIADLETIGAEVAAREGIRPFHEALAPPPAATVPADVTLPRRPGTARTIPPPQAADAGSDMDAELEWDGPWERPYVAVWLFLAAAGASAAAVLFRVRLAEVVSYWTS